LLGAEVRFREAALTRPGSGGAGPLAPDHALTLERLREIKAPLLLLWTEFDPSTPTPTARRAHERLPSTQFVELQSRAHWPRWEALDAFKQTVREILLA
jgi:pimeloyl-ACP methyl ester carboxylesterase